MNGTLQEAATLVQQLLQLISKVPSNQVEVVLCPPFTALGRVGELLKGSPIQLGAQNVHWEAKGAFTGEISASMLKELGCRWCVIGHSERRQFFGESDSTVRRRVQTALANELQVILCVGETLQQRQAGKTWAVLESQLQGGLEGVEPKTAASRLVIAYEPVWAIGTGVNATAAQAQEVHTLIRNWLARRFAPVVAQTVRIQYGGSVKADNAREILIEPDVDGALVGGASLDAKGFASIVQSAAAAKEKPQCSSTASS